MPRLKVRVTPKASRDEVAGWRGDELIVRVREAPERGRATEAAIALVARVLGVPRNAVRLCTGATSRHKVLEIDAIDERAMIAVLGASGSSVPSDPTGDGTGRAGRKS